MNDFISKTGRIDKVASVNADANKTTPVAKGNRAFDQLLTEQIQKDNNAATDSRPSSMLSEIQGPVKIPLATPSFDTPRYTRKLDTSIGLLETYAAFLNDPHKTLKQAHELLEKLLQQTKIMAEEFEKTPPPDDDLKQILTQLITTATVEEIKFNRGDYSS